MRRMVIISLLLFVVLAPGFSTGVQEKKAGPVTLTLWYPAGEITQTTRAYRDIPNLFAAFEAANNCKIELVAVDYDTMQQKILTAMAGGQVPDIGHISTTWMGGFLKDKGLYQVPEADAKAWMAVVTPEIQALSDFGGGKMYGYPNWGIDIYGLFWNKDMFKEAGLNPEAAPKYWADFRDTSKKTSVTNPDGTLKRVGYAIRHLGHPHGIVDKWHWLLEGTGMKFISDYNLLKGGSCSFNQPNARAGLQMAYDMVYKDKSTSLEFPDPRDCLLKGLASMQISETISIQVRAPKEAPNLNWGLAAPPAMKEGTKPACSVAGWCTSVFAQSKNINLAYRAIKWYNGKENDYAQAKQFMVTPRYTENWAKEPFSTDPYIKQFKALLPYARVYPRSLALNGIMTSIGTAVQKILHNELGVEAALVEAENTANAAIKALE